MKTERAYGFVAVLDILGYKQLCLNNTVDTIVFLIETVIEEVLTRAKATIDELDREMRVGSPWSDKSPTFAYRVFSDTIVVYQPFDGSVAIVDQGRDLAVVDPRSSDACRCYIHFSLFCSTLAKVLFEKGLPIRGAIDVGEYYIGDRTFAGSPLIVGHELAESLDFSGVAFTSEAARLVTSIIQSTPNSDTQKNEVAQLLMPYTVPLKNGKEERRFILDWFTWGGSSHSDQRVDPRHDVFRAFNAHNKPVGSKVLSKLQNTELSIRAFMVRERGME